MPADQSFDDLDFAMLSDTGRVRRGNEDFCAAVAERGLFVVCDGMGGAAAGEIASQLAATVFLDSLTSALPLDISPETQLRSAVHAANAEVYRRACQSDRTRGMGTTLVAALLEPPQSGRRLWLVHVGDSRGYRLRAGRFEQLTRDHSIVEEQILAGQLSREQAESSPMRNLITRSVGSLDRVEPEIRQLAAEPGDLYLLASDGLTRELSNEEIAGLLPGSGQSLEAACRALVAAANARGGRDNITVLLLRIH